MIRKPIWPYLVVGLFSFVIFQSFYHYYQLSTAAVPFMGMLRLSLVARTLGTLLLLVFF